jgi:hypothetical protein
MSALKFGADSNEISDLTQVLGAGSRSLKLTDGESASLLECSYTDNTALNLLTSRKELSLLIMLAYRNYSSSAEVKTDELLVAASNSYAISQAISEAESSQSKNISLCLLEILGLNTYLNCLYVFYIARSESLWRGPLGRFGNPNWAFERRSNPFGC